jgi:hypothetical protein
MIMSFDNQTQVHRGHKEARRALELWLIYTRARKTEVVKDWNACENCEPDRLPLEQRLERGEYGDNVIPIGISRPSLDTLDQLPRQSYTYGIDNDDISYVIAEVNKAVRAYFYMPASCISYVDFCRFLEEIKQELERQTTFQGAVSPYDRDRNLMACHYGFIYAGMGKLRGDVETGISQESPQSMEMAVAMLANLCDTARDSHVLKLQTAHTSAQDLQVALAGKSSLPSPNRF